MFSKLRPAFGLYGVGYMFVCFISANLLHEPRLMEFWFRTALPVTWIAAFATMWLSSPRPRPGWSSGVGWLKERFRRSPGSTVFYTGAIPLVVSFGATTDLHDVQAAERSLPAYELASVLVISLAVLFASYGWWRRRPVR